MYIHAHMHAHTHVRMHTHVHADKYAQSDHSHRYTLERGQLIVSMGNLTSRRRNEVHGIYSPVIAIR